jgi:hypothetical protein
MVPYKPTPLIQSPPPICPKCGSHRTEIVGFSTDRLIIVIRCSACGERSTIQATPEWRLATTRLFDVDHLRILNWQHT